MKKLLSLLLSALICVTIIPDYRRLICAEELTEQAPVAEVVEQVAEDLAEAADQVQQSVETFVDEAKEIAENIQENLNKEEEEVPVEKQETTEAPVSEVLEEKVPDEKENLPENNEGEETPVVEEEVQEPMMTATMPLMSFMLTSAPSSPWTGDDVFYYGDTDGIGDIAIEEDLYEGDGYTFTKYSYFVNNEGSFEKVSEAPTEVGLYEKRAIFNKAEEKKVERFAFEIKKAEITPVWKYDTLTYVVGEKLTYNGFNRAVTSVEFVNNNNEPVSIPSDQYTLVGADSARNAGNYTYTVSLSGDAADNYELTSTSYELVINPKTLTVTWPTETSHEYDGTDYKPAKSDVTVKGWVSGEGTHYKKNIVGDSAIEAGEHNYNVGLEAKDATNYPVSNYTFDSTNTFTFTISQASVTVTWPTDTVTYNADVQAWTKDDITLSPAVEFTLYGSTDAKDADTYNYEVILTDSTNYTLTNSTNTLTINPATVTVAWPTTTSHIYNGEVQSVTLTKNDFTGIFEDKGDYAKAIQIFKSGEKIGAQKVKDVGEYTFKAVLSEKNSSGFNPNNYILEDYTLTINQATLTPTKWVLANGNEITEGFTKEEIYTGVNQGVESVELEVNSDESDNKADITELVTAINANINGDDAINASTTPYEYTIAIPTEYQNNFKLVEESDTFAVTVKKATLTPNWKFNNCDNNGGAGYTASASLVFDGKKHGLGGTGGLTFSVDSTLDESVNYDDLTSKIVDGRTKSPNKDIRGAGDYTFTIAVPADYENNFQLAEGTTTFTLTITPKPITIVWKNGTSAQELFNNITYTPEVDETETNKLLGEGDSFEYIVHCYKDGSEIDKDNAKDVGTYTYKVELSGTGTSKADNYTVSGDYVLEIIQVTIYPEWELKNNPDLEPFIGNEIHVTYNGKWQGVKDTIKFSTTDPNINAEVLQAVQYDIVRPDPGAKNASENPYTFKVELKGDNKDNYVLASDTLDVYVDPMEVDVNWNEGESLEVTYDGKLHNPTVDESSLVFANGEEFDTIIVCKDEDGNPIDPKLVKQVGTYTFNVELTNKEGKSLSTDNYEIVNDTFTLTINQATLTPTWVLKNGESVTGNEAEFFYNGKQQGVDHVTFKADTTIDVTMVEPIITKDREWATCKNVKNSPFTYTISLPEEYQRNFKIKEGTDTLSIAIKPVKLTVTWDDSLTHTVVYDGEAHTPTVAAVTGFVNDEVLEYDIQCFDHEGTEITNLDTVVNSGIYTYKVKVKDTGSYQAQNYYIDDIDDFDLTIDKAEVVPVWKLKNDEPDKTYIINQASFEYDGKVHGVLFDEITFNATNSTASTASLKAEKVSKVPNENVKDVKDYVITIKLDDESAKNFEIQASAESFTISITPKHLTVEWDESSRWLPWMPRYKEYTYDGTDHRPHKKDFALSGFVDGESGKPAMVNKDEAIDFNGFQGQSYSIKLSPDNEATKVDNYTIDDNNFVVYVRQREATVAWKDENVYVDGLLEYSGKAAKPLTAEITNIVDKDKDKVVVNVAGATEPTIAGTYTYKITSLIGDRAQNYYLNPTNSQKTLTIAKKRISLEISQPEEFVYDKLEHKPNLEVVGIVEGETQDDAVTVKIKQGYADVTPINAGRYQMIISAKSNYTIKLAEPQTKFVPMKGWVQVDTTDSVTHEFTIKQREVSYKWVGEPEYLYNGTSQHPTYEIASGSVLEGDELVNFNIYEKGQFGRWIASESINAGQYKVVLTNKPGTSNYKVILPKEMNYRIAPRKILVKITLPENLVYDKTFKKPTFEEVDGSDGILPADTNKVLEVKTYAKNDKWFRRPIDAIDAGQYVAKVNTKFNPNYEIKSQKETVEFEITKRPITVQLSELEKTYDGHTQWAKTEIIEGSLAGFGWNKDQLFQVMNVNYEDGHKNAGEYAISITDGFNARNYDYKVVDKDNEEITDWSNVKLVIKKRVLRVKWENTTFEYSEGNKWYPTATLTNDSSNIVWGEWLELSLNTPKQEEVGKYKAEVVLQTPSWEMKPEFEWGRTGINWMHKPAVEQDQTAIGNYDLQNASTSFYIYDPAGEQKPGREEDPTTGKVTSGIINKVPSTTVQKILMDDSIGADEALAILNANKDTNKEAKKILDEFVGNDKNIHISTNVTTIDASKPEYANALRIFADRGLADGKNAIFLDITLWASVDGEPIGPTKLTSTGTYNITFKLTLTVDQAAKIGITGDASDRLVKICRVHEGNADTLDGTLTVNKLEGVIQNYTVSFTTDKFSEYAIYTVQKPSHKSSSWKAPETGVDSLIAAPMMANVATTGTTFSIEPNYLMNSLLLAIYALLADIRRIKYTIWTRLKEVIQAILGNRKEVQETDFKSDPGSRFTQGPPKNKNSILKEVPFDRKTENRRI